MGFAHKINTRYHADGTSKPAYLPAIFTESGLIISHLRYLFCFRSKSPSWREKSVQALTLFIEYMDKNGAYFSSAKDAFKGFANAIEYGTVDEESLEDKSNLYWRSRSAANCQELINHLNHYFDYIANINLDKPNILNPWRKASSHEKRINIAAHYRRKYNSFLGHLSTLDSAKTDKARWTTTPNFGSSPKSDIKSFPEEKFYDLLNFGLVRKVGNAWGPDYGAQAIVYLMHFGGIRKSETFHIYVGDITVDKDTSGATVAVYHPSQGASPSGIKDEKRREFLANNYRLMPRNELPRSKRLHAGWKNPELVNKRNFYVVRFFPPEKSIEFLHIWKNYLLHQRVDAPPDFEHPFAFTNTTGRPLTIKNFQRIYRSAVLRIGLEHTKYSGTSEHGHRHAYGKRLKKHGASEQLIQKGLHQRNPNSSKVYTEPTESEIHDLLNSLEKL